MFWEHGQFSKIDCNQTVTKIISRYRFNLSQIKAKYRHGILLNTMAVLLCGVALTLFRLSPFQLSAKLLESATDEPFASLFLGVVFKPLYNILPRRCNPG